MGMVSTQALRLTANTIRKHALNMACAAKLGHLGGDFSAADILAVLYHAILRIDPAYPAAESRDRFVLSKGHISGSFYATLASAGFFPTERLSSYMQPLSALNGHPDRNALPGIEANTGALGHGLPIALGMTLAGKLTAALWRVFVLTGDGELQEGSNWEAAMTAAHHGLDRLCVTVDRNRLQQGDRVDNTTALEPLADKWRAFGWAVEEVDGHDHAALLELYQRLPLQAGKPSCIIANTVKGRGVSFMEDQVGWHHRIPSPDEQVRALAELNAALPALKVSA